MAGLSIVGDANSFDFLEKARQLVFDYVKVHLAKTNNFPEFAEDDVAVYWFSKEGDDWRVALTTSMPDNVYYRVTYSSSKKETSIDVYHNYNTIIIPDDKDN